MARMQKLDTSSGKQAVNVRLDRSGMHVSPYELIGSESFARFLTASKAGRSGAAVEAEKAKLREQIEQHLGRIREAGS